MVGFSGPSNLKDAFRLPTASDLLAEAKVMTSGMAKLGEDVGKGRILSSGTTGDWSSHFKGHPRRKGAVREATGRVDTGNMLDNYKSKTKVSGSKFTGEVGWVDGDDGYFMEQEGGFTNHYGRGISVSVEGMETFIAVDNALRETAGDIMRFMAEDLFNKGGTP